MTNIFDSGVQTAVMPAICMNCGEPVADMDHIVNEDIDHVCRLVALTDLEVRSVHRQPKGPTLEDAILAGDAVCATAPYYRPGCRCRRCRQICSDGGQTLKEAIIEAKERRDEHTRPTAKRLPVVEQG